MWLCFVSGIIQIHGVLLSMRNDPVCQTFTQTLVEVVVGCKIWQMLGVGSPGVQR